MKNLTFVFIFFFASISYAHNNKHLVTYGQVWGFLKYHHEYPSTVDWDERLLNDFDKLENATDQEMSQIIDALLADCNGTIDEKTEAPDFKLMTSVFDWLENNTLTAEHIAKIKTIRDHKADFTNKYVKVTQLGTADFSNEKKYDEISFDQRHLFLAITRYWNAINYYFPYRDLIPEDWTETYRQMLPVVLSCEDEESYMMAFRRMSSKLQEGHGFITPSEKMKKKYPINTHMIFPFHVMDLKDGTFITSVVLKEGQKINLQRGDKLISVNGQTTEERWNTVGQFIAASNDYASRKYDWNFRRTDKDSVSIEVLRNDEIIQLKMANFTFEELTAIWKNKQNASTSPLVKLPYEQRKDSLSGISYLYVDLDELERNDIDRKFKKAIRKNSHIIFDVRNYPNWTVIKLCKKIIKGKQHFALGGRLTTKKPGAIKFTPTQKVGGWKTYSGNIYILVDRVTQSQAEYTVMALQLHPRSTTIGGQTAGADGNVTRIPLPYGLNAAFSGISIVYPDGGQTQQTGILRDIKVIQDSSYLKNPRNDKILNTAIRMIRESVKMND